MKYSIESFGRVTMVAVCTYFGCLYLKLFVGVLYKLCVLYVVVVVGMCVYVLLFM